MKKEEKAPSIEKAGVLRGAVSAADFGSAQTIPSHLGLVIHATFSAQSQNSLSYKLFRHIMSHSNDYI